jgi:hypothetical protein
LPDMSTYYMAEYNRLKRNLDVMRRRAEHLAAEHDSKAEAAGIDAIRTLHEGCAIAYREVARWCDVAVITELTEEGNG